MASVLLALFSAAVGAMLGGIVNAIVGRYAVFKETQALASALRAELEAVLSICKRRKHVENLDSTITYLTGLRGQPGPSDFYDTGGESPDAHSCSTRTAGRSAF